MLALAAPLVNTTALWKIIVAALAGGAGVAIAFGLLLLGLSRAKATHNPGVRAVNYAMSGLARLFCVAAVVLGIYAMAKKPASAKPAKAKAAALTVPTRGGRLVA